jgi:hypothetical protein
VKNKGPNNGKYTTKMNKNESHEVTKTGPNNSVQPSRGSKIFSEINNSIHKEKNSGDFSHQVLTNFNFSYLFSQILITINS